MRIDAHQHFWIYDPLRDEWITDEMKKIKRDFLPNHLIPVLKENAIDGCVVVQADQSETETIFLLDLAQRNNSIKGVVGWVDLRSPEIEERLAHYSQFQLLKGFRHVVQSEPENNFILQEDFCRGVGLLKHYNFTYDILIYPRHLLVAQRFVERFPDQRFVLDHLGKPPIRSKQIDSWARGIELLAQNKNVYCKISGMITEADWKTWNYNDLVPYIEVIAESFGPYRILYGSDWPVCLVAGSYRDQLSIVEKYFRTFLNKEQEAIFGNNAVEFYNL
jgi:L-fuconolactonase